MAVTPGPFTGLVQFPHPGTEHKAGAYEEGVFPWNAGDHARKFLESSGRWRSEDGSSGSGRLRFWGEYEPPSAVRPLGPEQGLLPRWVHTPLYPPAGDGHRQNTDPLVLGGFWYSNCKQHRVRAHPSPTVMQRLEPGSIVLFGSKRDHAFVLDTVFVVADREEYGRADVESLDVPEHVKDMALRPLYSNPGRALHFSLYRGATVDQPVDGRWSFVPALPVQQPGDRFARPRVDLPDGIIKHTHGMGLRSVALTPEVLQDCWERLLDLVHGAGLVAATHLDVPPGDALMSSDDRVGSGGTC